MKKKCLKMTEEQSNVDIVTEESLRDETGFTFRPTYQR